MPRRVDVDVPLFRKLWLAGVPMRVIASRLGVGADTLGGMRRRLGLPARTATTRPPPRLGEASDPSPEEIAERAAEVRARWDDETRKRRLVGHSDSDERNSVPDSLFDGYDDDGSLE